MEGLHLLFLSVSVVILWLFAIVNIASSVYYPGNNKIHQPESEGQVHTLLWSLSFLSQKIRRRVGYIALWFSSIYLFGFILEVSYSYLIQLTPESEFKVALLVLLFFFALGFVLGYITFYGVDSFIHRIFTPNDER